MRSLPPSPVTVDIVCRRQVCYVLMMLHMAYNQWNRFSSCDLPIRRREASHAGLHPQVPPPPRQPAWQTGTPGSHMWWAHLQGLPGQTHTSEVNESWRPNRDSYRPISLIHPQPPTDILLKSFPVWNKPVDRVRGKYPALAFCIINIYTVSMTRAPLAVRVGLTHTSIRWI